MRVDHLLRFEPGPTRRAGPFPNSLESPDARSGSQVRDACRERNLPLVGHNCLFDVLFLLEHFEAPLDPSYEKRPSGTFPPVPFLQ